MLVVVQDIFEKKKTIFLVLLLIEHYHYSLFSISLSTHLSLMSDFHLCWPPTLIPPYEMSHQNSLNKLTQDPYHELDHCALDS